MGLLDQLMQSQPCRSDQHVLVFADDNIFCVGYYLVSLYQVWSTGRQDHTGPVDAIVVLGAAQYDGRPSPQLAARLDHVVDIWPEGRCQAVSETC